MSFALVWELSTTNQEDGSATKQVVIGHPGTFSETDEQAKEEGRRILTDDQIEEDLRNSLTPLAVVEVDEDMGDDIQERCEEVEVGTELLFYDLDCYDRWHSQSWWPKS